MVAPDQSVGCARACSGCYLDERMPFSAEEAEASWMAERRHDLLHSYQRYYNEVRTHLSLHKDAPVPREVRAAGRVLAVPILGGLHHQYVRV